MRRYLLIIFLVVFSATAKSQITWDGGGDAVSWNDAGNWVGNVVPGAADNVLLDNSVVAGSYTVNLPTGAVSVTVASLTITPVIGNTITLLLPTGNTQTTDAFITTGTGYTVVINNGGVFENSSGVTSGTNLTITDTFRINDGGRYIHRTRSGHAGWTSRISRISGTENGVFEFDVPSTLSYAISTSLNRVYPTLELSAVAAGGTKSYTSNAGGNPVVNGNLIIKGGTTYSYTPPLAGITFTVNNDCLINSTGILDLATSGPNAMIFQVKGNIVLNGTITELGSSTTTTLELNGTTNQQISGNGSLQNSITFLINNAAGATLNAPLILPYSLTLTSGKITTSATNLLTMVDNATYTGGSITSFIDGPMKKIGDDNFIFPVGKGSIYAPIGISGTGGVVSDEFTAEYLRTNPQSLHGACPAACAGGLDHVSFVEYWKLIQDVGISAKQVSFEVHALSFCKMLSNTFVSRWNGAQWTNETTTILAGPNACGSGLECGTIQASNTTTAFWDFTLATDQPFLNNPLPVTLVDFKVRKYSEQAAIAEWELTDYCFTATRFELEHSTDKTSFAVIALQPGKENSRFYFYNDTRIAKGTNWYRLRITEVGGKVTYSKVIAVINDSKGLLITSVFPNPVSNTATITLSAARSGMADIQLYDISGTLVYRRRSAIAEGTNYLPVEMGKLSAGVYHLAVQSADSKAVYRLVKQ